ncbi:hypothetical protein BD779DRAFT_1681358 [Infundibulicybe gibba]|nr:hypothetical protein BD779DRAFT_1681358 [Infundibulicybe gibba]
METAEAREMPKTTWVQASNKQASRDSTESGAPISLTALASSFQKLANRPSLAAKPGSALIRHDISQVLQMLQKLCVDNIYRLDLMAQEPDSLAINPLDPKWDSVDCLTIFCSHLSLPASLDPQLTEVSEYLETLGIQPPATSPLPAPQNIGPDPPSRPTLKDIPQDYTCEDPAQALSHHGPSDNDVDPDNDDADRTITQVENQLDKDNQDDQEPIDPDAVGPDVVDPDVIDQDDDPVKSLDPIDPESSPLPVRRFPYILTISLSY